MCTVNTEAVKVTWLVGAVAHRATLIRVWNSGGMMISGRKQKNSDKGPAIFLLHQERFFTPEDGTNRLPQNIGKILPLLGA